MASLSKRLDNATEAGIVRGYQECYVLLSAALGAAEDDLRASVEQALAYMHGRLSRGIDHLG